MIRVLTAFSEVPEDFDTEDYAVEYGALHIFARTDRPAAARQPLKTFGPGAWIWVAPTEDGT